MLTIANQGREVVKKHEKYANVICERPLRETDAPITSRWKSAKSLQFMSLLIKSMISVLLVIK